jgi:uncharacterized protein (DUF1330 family)
MMAAYMVGRIDVTDWEQYKKYTEVTPDVIAQYGGRFIARGGECIALEGAEETHRTVLIEFPTVEDAKTFYDSAEYQEAKKLRAGAATASFIVIDGCC